GLERPGIAYIEIEIEILGGGDIDATVPSADRRRLRVAIAYDYARQTLGDVGITQIDGHFVRGVDHIGEDFLDQIALWALRQCDMVAGVLREVVNHRPCERIIYLEAHRPPRLDLEPPAQDANRASHKLAAFDRGDVAVTTVGRTAHFRPPPVGLPHAIVRKRG